jgi:hypothetical protein
LDGTSQSDAFSEGTLHSPPSQTPFPCFSSSAQEGGVSQVFHKTALPEASLGSGTPTSTLISISLQQQKNPHQTETSNPTAQNQINSELEVPPTDSLEGEPVRSSLRFPEKGIRHDIPKGQSLRGQQGLLPTPTRSRPSITGKLFNPNPQTARSNFTPICPLSSLFSSLPSPATISSSSMSQSAPLAQNCESNSQETESFANIFRKSRNI